MTAVPEGQPILVGCGILAKEVRHLIQKNRWPVDTLLLDSSLHVDFGRLGHALEDALVRTQTRDAAVMYGACHPLMDGILTRAGRVRTQGQNCIEMLLGARVFEAELESGSFFLLEDWAWQWERVVTSSMGNNLAVIREIYRHSQTCMLAIRTPCSGDFSAAAMQAAAMVGLPLRWMDAPLDHLEKVLVDVLRCRAAEGAWTP
jgi:hypothetical protein